MALAHIDAATHPFEVVDIRAVHRQDQVEAGEVVGMYVSTAVVDAVAAVGTFGHGQRVGRRPDV